MFFNDLKTPHTHTNEKKEEVDIVMIMTLFCDLSHIYQSMDKKNHHHSNFEICGLNILVHKNSNNPSQLRTVVKAYPSIRSLRCVDIRIFFSH